MFKISTDGVSDGPVPLFSPDIVTGPGTKKSSENQFKVAALVVNAASRASRRSNAAMTAIKSLRKKKSRHEGFNMEVFRKQVQRSLDAAVMAETLEPISPRKVLPSVKHMETVDVVPNMIPFESTSSGHG